MISLWTTLSPKTTFSPAHYRSAKMYAVRLSHHAHCVFVVRARTLHVLLQVFFSSIEGSSSVDPALVKKGLRFRENLTRRYHWDFSAEPDEYAPTIVNTD